MLVGETCSHCGLTATEVVPGCYASALEAVDPCLGMLPGVVHACCGHGGQGKPYVVLAPGHAPGTSLHDIDDFGLWEGQTALDFFASQGVGPNK